jgi:MFS family permease
VEVGTNKQLLLPTAINIRNLDWLNKLFQKNIGLIMNKNIQETSNKSWLILLAVCLSALVLPISFTGGAVATTAISNDLGGTPSQLRWITNAFMLSFGSLLMLAGTLADRLGRKKMFSTGLALYVVTSLLCAFSPSIEAFDISRAFQGLAAAFALASGSAALAQEFTGHTRAKAFSFLGTTFGIGLAFGPLFAGILIGTLGWPSVFIATAIIAAISLVFAIPLMHETSDPKADRIDWAGALTFTGSLVSFTYAIIEVGALGWSHPNVIQLLVLSGGLLGIFLLIESIVERPMLHLELFKYPRFLGVQMLPIGTCCCYISLVVMLPLSLIGVVGMSEMSAGFLMVALSAPMLFVPLIASYLARWINAGLLTGIGFLIAAAGLFWMSATDFNTNPFQLILPMIVIGIGAGIPWGLMDGLSVSVVPKERAGMAAGIFNTSRVAGEGIILAISSATLSVILASIFSENISDVTNIKQASEHLAMGNLQAAMEFFPSLDRVTTISLYLKSYAHLLHILAWITIASAFISFLFLSKKNEAKEY